MGMQQTAPKHLITPTLLHNYFQRPPQRSVFTSVMIGMFLLICIVPCCLSVPYINSMFQTFIVLGIIATIGIPTVIGCSPLISYLLLSRPTDKEYDEWVGGWLHSKKEQGFHELHINSYEFMGQPLLVQGQVYPGTSASEIYNNDVSLVIRPGKDGYPRSSINRFMFFYPMQDFIAIFTTDVNALSNQKYDFAQKYYYQDVVGIETVSVNTHMTKRSIELRDLTLKMSNGKEIGLPSVVSNPDVTQTIRAINTLIWDKKRNAQS